MSVFSGIASLAGGLISGGMQMSAQSSANSANESMMRESNAFNAAEAEKARAYQTKMSNTSFQRGVADLKAAGINPISLGSGAADPMPSGASASSVSPPTLQPTLGALGKGLMEGITNFVSASNSTQQTQSNVMLNSALASKAAADASYTLSGIPVKELKNAGARAIEPMINSAVDAVRGLTSKLPAAVNSAGQSSAKSGPLSNPPDLQRLGTMIKHMSGEIDSSKLSKPLPKGYAELPRNLYPNGGYYYSGQ